MIARKGKPVSRYPLIQRQTRIGRRSGNDLVLNSWSVSGSHAVLIQDGNTFVIEDLGSRNGTYVGEARVGRTRLEVGNVVRIADYTLTLVEHRTAMAYEPTLLVRSGGPGKKAQLQHLDGSSAGQVTPLDQVITTLGTADVCQVTFIRRVDDFAVRLIEGTGHARLNGAVLGSVPLRVYNGDVLELAGERLQFQLLDA
jgi:hypothetical protein